MLAAVIETPVTAVLRLSAPIRSDPTNLRKPNVQLASLEALVRGRRICRFANQDDGRHDYTPGFLSTVLTFSSDSENSEG